MTIDEAIRELESARARHGGDAVVPAWAAESVARLGLPPLPDPPGAAHLPTSREFAEQIIPRVRAVASERKPFLAFLAKLLPLIKFLVPIILQILPLLALADTGPVAPARYPWRDDDADIPQDVKRAAAMDIRPEG